MVSIYLKPIGFSHGSDADDAVKEGFAGRLAGGSVAFSGVEIIERDGARLSVEARPYTSLVMSGDAAIRNWLERLTAPRAPVGAMDFRTLVVIGIVNVTPDSFSDHGEHAEPAEAIRHGRAMAKAGAHILDIGGESTRPGSDPVDGKTELERILPVLDGLGALGLPLSIDTRKAAVMREAARAGASIINDVSGLTHDPEALNEAVRLGLPVILMHSKGEPKVMQDDPRYDHVLLDVYDALEANLARCVAAGLSRHRLIADPGIGFGKSFDHNLQILNGFSLFHGLGVPLLLGVSRKAFIGAIANEPVARRRVPGSISAAMAGIIQGVQMVRVHDVPETVQAIKVWERIVGAGVRAA